MEVSRALFAVLLSLGKWLPVDFRKQPILTELEKYCSNGGMLGFVNDLLDAELDSWPNKPENDRIRDSWRTARKWLSGLSGLEHLAFWDLDPLRLNDQGSVLDAIARFPLRSIQHGAVIGTDNRLHDFINSLLHDAPWTVRLVARLKSDTIDELVQQADDIYNTDAMCFPARTPPVLLAEYQQGIKAGTYNLAKDLAAAAHDFVIPSASQLLVPYDNWCIWAIWSTPPPAT